MSFFSELKRRNVYRVAVLYIIVSWLVLQVTDVFLSFLPLPDWTPNLVFVLLVLGFPIALVLAWAFELTPEGLRPEIPEGEAPPAGKAGRKLDILIIVGLVVVAAYAFYTRGGPAPAERGLPDSAAPTKIDSIVVLPLQDLTGDPAEAYFVSGMHEALITELSQVEALRVISRTSASAYRNSDKPLPQIARELDVDAVVEGSVLRVGDTVRVTAQLIDATTDEHLWAANFDREVTDILSLYGDVAQEIVEQIRIEVTPEEASRLASTGQVDPQVYERYLQGRFLCENWSPQEMARGVDLMREAVRLDPDWAPARAELALCLQYEAFFNFVQPLDILEESVAQAERAVALDERLAEAHVALAGVRYYLEYEREEAEAELRRALELNPGSVKALIHMSWLLGESGRFDEAVDVTRKAIERDPLNTSAAHALGQAQYLARRFEEAVEAYQAAWELDRSDPVMPWSLSLTYWEMGEEDLALEHAREAVELGGGASIFRGALAYQLAQRGFEVEARRIIAELKEDPLAAGFDLAVIYIGLGEYERALDRLVEAYERRNSQIVYLPHGPVFDPLRRHPRFQALLERLGWSGRGPDAP